jgi:hypothetical protein
MNRIPFKFSLIFLFAASLLHGIDTLKIAPCDEVAVNLFGDLICLSRDEGILRRVVGGQTRDIFSSGDLTYKMTLQDLQHPVLDGADKIYLLDEFNNVVIGLDRFLNLYSITPLHDRLLSPGAFTVTSEHDWLIYDDFYGQLWQIHPGEDFYTNWGDKTVSGDIELFSVDQVVIVYPVANKLIRIYDEEGTTLEEFSLPDSLKISRIFPVSRSVFGLQTDSGVFIWKPRDGSVRYLSDLKDVVHISRQGSAYMLITRDGVIVNIQ